MTTNFTRILIAILFLTLHFFSTRAFAQTGVLNPNDPIVLYNAASPPVKPAVNTLAKWVKTTRMSYNTDDFKAYYYNGVQFRLKWPKSFATAAAGQTYPLYLFFHGTGEGGTWYDNEFQFTHGADVHQKAVNNGTFDGFLLYPQSANSSGGWNQQQLDAIATIITNYLIPEQKVDVNRILVNGLSGGGDATWEFGETHPTLGTAIMPMSAANISDESYANSLKFTPMWLFQGGLDVSPDPSTTLQVVNAYNAAGSNLKYTLYPNDGHDTWDDAWRETDYFPFLLRAHKANPWAIRGRTQYCPGDIIKDTLGVTAGFDGYQWRMNGAVVAGATSNTYIAPSIGTYDCRILRGSTWSPWSPTPLVISIKAPTVSPNIQLNGLISDVVPAPDGSNFASLKVPAGYVSYTWERVDSPATSPAILSSTTNILNGATPGKYAVKVTELYGCSSSFSKPFTVIRANGPNPPSAPTGFLATTLSKTQIRLSWKEDPAPAHPETQFEIYQGLAINGPYTLLGYSPAHVDSFVSASLSPKTIYYYLVRAIDTTAASATAGPSSSQTQSDITAPTAPPNLRSSGISQTSVRLVWDSAKDDVGVVAYDIYVNGNKAYTVANIDTFTVYNLVNGQPYTFTVKARDFAGNVSPFSNQLAVTTGYNGLIYKYFTGSWSLLPDFNTLSPVTTGIVPNVTLSPALSTIDYAFTWSGVVNIPVTGSYTFQTSSDDGSNLYIDVPYSATAVPTVKNDGLHARDTITGKTLTLTAGLHTFFLTYMQGGGSAVMLVNWMTPQTGGRFVPVPDSAFVQTVTPAGTAPAAPGSLTAVAASAKKINLSWKDKSNNETGFQLFRSTSSGGPYTAIATVGSNKTSYGDSSLSPSTTYYYKIQAINQYGSSKFNIPDSVSLAYSLYNPYPYPNLSNLATSTPVSTGVSTNFSLGVTTATVNFALSFNGFIRIPAAGSYTFYTNSDDGSNLYIDSVLVVNNNGLHGATEKSGLVTLTAGSHKIRTDYFNQGGGFGLTVSWSGPGIVKAAIPDSVLSILAAHATTLAAPSVPAAPSGLTGSVMGQTHISLSWVNNAANATGFEVWRSPATNTNYLLAASLPVTTAYVDSGLTKSTLYFYKVRAINEGGNSAFGNEISVTTGSTSFTTVTLTHVASQTMLNDTTLTIPLTAASSKTGSVVTFTAAGLPAFCSLADSHNGTASLTLRPNSAQVGVYPGIILTATDNYGGSVSDTFTITVNGRNMKTVRLSFNTASNPVTTAGWNGMNSAATAGAVVSALKDNTGLATTVGVTLVSGWEGAYASGMNTGNNSGIYPDNVLQNLYDGSTSNPYSFKVTGLSSNKKYALVFFAGYPWTASDKATYGNLVTNYTVGTQTVTLDAANNISQTAELAGLSPDAGGNITVTVNKPVGSAYCILSDLQILTYDAGSVTTLTPPSGLVANGLTGNSIQLNWSGSADTRTGFEIWRTANPSGTFSLLTTVGGSVITFKDSSLPANSTWFYKVREAVTGGQFSAFSNIAGGSVVQYTVNLSFNSQQAGAERAPWNDLNTLVSNGFTLPNMMNMNAQPTGISFNVVNTFTSFNDQLGLSTGNNTGVVPDTVMKTFYYNSQGDTSRIRIGGLSRTGIFNFGFYAGTDFSNATTIADYQIGSHVVPLNAFNNTTNMVFINGVRPDSNGSVLITFYTGGTSPYGMWNSLTIQGMPSPDVIAADSAGTAGRIGSQAINWMDWLNIPDMPLLLPDSTPVAPIPLAPDVLTAYPNPFTDNVTVKFGFRQHIDKFSMVLTDNAGRIVQQQEYDNISAGNWQQTLYLGNLPRGIYFIKLYGLPEKKTSSFKLIKVKL